MVGFSQMVQSRFVGTPRARAESWSIVGIGPVQPAADMHMQIMIVDKTVAYFMWIIIGGLDCNTFAVGGLLLICGMFEVCDFGSRSIIPCLYRFPISFHPEH